MKKLFIHTECTYPITEWDNGEVFSLTFTPGREGWETDGGCEGYGLTKDVAQEIANAYNAIQAADALAKAARELDTEIDDTDQLTLSTCQAFKIALEAYEAARGRAEK